MDRRDPNVGSPNTVFGHRTNYLHGVINNIVGGVSNIYGGLPGYIRAKLFDILLSHIRANAAENLLANIRQLGLPTTPGEVIQYGQLALDRIFEFLGPAEQAQLHSTFSGMPRQHRLQLVTQSPLEIGEARGSEGIASRVATIRRNFDAASKALFNLAQGTQAYRDQQQKVQRLKENLVQWTTALQGYTPAATPDGGARGGPEDVAERPPPAQRPRLDDTPEGLDLGDTQTQIEPTEHNGTQVQEVSGVRDDDGIDIDEWNQVGTDDAGAMPSGGTTAAMAGAAGSSAMQGIAGRIGKNKPYFSADGSTVIFSGSRLMYSWGYNFAVQKSLGETRENINLAYGDNVLKPLGFDIPWDWIPFYCTPAEWAALDWHDRKIEIDHVEITVTPHAKTVCFTTGSQDSQPVSTEYDCYVYKAEGLNKIPGLVIQRVDNKSTVIDWGASGVGQDLVVPVNYKRLKEKYWGPLTQAFKGSEGFGTCTETVKREMETLTCMQIPKLAEGDGQVLWSELHDVYDINGVMNKPFIHKKFKPVCGLVNDPRRKALPISALSPIVNKTDAPYFQQGKPEALLRDVALMWAAEKNDLNNVKVNNIDDVPGHVRVIGNTITFSTGQEAYLTSSSVASFQNQVTDAINSDGFLTPALESIKAFWDITQTVSDIKYGKSQPEQLLKDYSLPDDTLAPNNYDYQGLQTYNAKIERGNSFIPMGADNDLFPAPVQQQENICIGIKPVLASDPNTGNVSWLKASLTWLIEYKMVIKQTYIPPDIRQTEPSMIRKADYSLGFREYGAQINHQVKYVSSNNDTKIGGYCILNPAEEDITLEGKLIRSIRTAKPAHPDDETVYGENLQKNMTKLPRQISLRKYRNVPY